MKQKNMGTNILNISVSLFANAMSIEPKTVNLYDWLVSDENKRLVEKYRYETNSEAKSKLKKLLPCITPSGVFQKRGLEGLETHSGFICVDIDKKPNSHLMNFNDLKTLIKELDCIAYCSVSASGEGYFALISILHPERHKEHFESLRIDFEACGIKIDNACSDISRLRFATYDNNPYINFEAKIYDKIVSSKKIATKHILPRINNKKYENEIENLINDVEFLGLDMTEKYEDWFAIGCGIAKEFGESGRKYFHRVSQFYHSYNPYEVDKQYTACMNDKNVHSIATLFYYAKKHGLEYGFKISPKGDFEGKG